MQVYSGSFLKEKVGQGIIEFFLLLGIFLIVSTAIFSIYVDSIRTSTSALENSSYQVIRVLEQKLNEEFGPMGISKETDYDANGDGKMYDVCDLAEIVKEQKLDRGIERSLVAKADNACKQAERGNLEPVRGDLAAFINEIEAQRDKQIPSKAADTLIEFAENVMRQLGI